MRKFNTSGPNIPEKHYTIIRKNLINKGIEMVEDERYFTIWAPRQTGKSTYFNQLADELVKKGIDVVLINVESYSDASKKVFLRILVENIVNQAGIPLHTIETFTELENEVRTKNEGRVVLIIDEIEGLNNNLLGQFLHTIRNLYHSRNNHCLKSVILVGVSNVVGVISDNASPFNITDNLSVPYFTDDEVVELFKQHDIETGQIFDKKVVCKISEITANQPSLVNGFARKLVEKNQGKALISFDEYLKVEDWYLTEAIDKNFSNILNKALKERNFVENLLFTDNKIPFKIDRPAIKLLHTNGLIKKDNDGNVAFWVPFYKKRLYDAFYPYMNGEQKQITRTVYEPDYYSKNGELNFEKLINSYKEYVKRRGFKPHREKDEKGRYKSIKEAALIYSFETFIHAVISELKGKIYREANTGLGKSDMVINIKGNEFLIETKIYSSPGRFVEGKKQLAYYCKSLGLKKGIYLVYCPNDIKYPKEVQQNTEFINEINIFTYLVEYDETKWEQK